MSRSELPTDEQSTESISLLESGHADSSLPRCEKCGSHLRTQESLVCRQCGWYESISSYVEIDQNWEASNDPDVVQEIEEDKEPFVLPNWVLTMTGCVTVVILESILVCWNYAIDSDIRSRWSTLQLFIGGTAVVVCHFVAFVLLIIEDSEVSLLDILLKPIRPWILRVNELPFRQWICHVAASGLVAVLMSILVLGSISTKDFLIGVLPNR